MKKTMKFVALATLAVFALSCGKEIAPVEEQTNSNVENTVKGEPVTLSVSLAPETKITHDYTTNPDTGKKAVKPSWEASDALTVTFKVSGAKRTETFAIDTKTLSADGMTATFYNNDSLIGTRDSETTIDVAYAGNATDWSIQDGTVENLPEVLSKTGISDLSSQIALSSELTYFHFDLSAAASPAEALSLTNAYFYNSTKPFIVDSSSNTGEITITPASAFTYTTGGAGTGTDFFVAVKLAGDSNGDTFGIDLQNGDHYTGIQGYSLTWAAAKTYETGKTYKKTSTSATLTYNDGLVGLEDNTTGFYGDHSTSISIPVDSRLHLQYINYNKGTGDGWFNGDLVISNTENDYTNDAAYRYFFLRNDGWGAGDANYNASYLFKDRNGYPDQYFEAFMTDLNGATIDVIIDHGRGGYVYVTTEAVATSGARLHQYYSQIVSVSDPIYAFYTVDQCHLVMKSATLSTIPDGDNLSSISADATTVYYNGAVDKMNISPYGFKVTAATTGSDMDITNRYLCSPTGLNSIRATSASVTYAGLTSSAATVSVSENTIIPSSTVLGGVSTGWQDNDGYMFTVAPKTSQVVGATMLSRKTYNWDCPTLSLRANDGTWLANFRLDNWGTGGTYKDNDSDAKVKVLRSSNWDWDSYKNMIDGATIYFTVSNNGNGKASVRFDLINGVNTFFQYFDDITIAANENIKFCISTDYCELTIL